MEPRDEEFKPLDGDEQPSASTAEVPETPAGAPVDPASAWAPLPPDLAGPPRAAAPIWPPLPPDLAGPPHAAGPTVPGASAPSDPGTPPYAWSAGAGMPPGGQPPYSPPYGYAWPPGGPYGSAPADEPRRGRKALAAAVAGVALVAAGLGAGLGVAFSSNGSSPSSSGGGVALLPKSSETAVSPSGGAASTNAIAKAVEPAVVDINVVDATPAGYSPQEAAGTGMIVTSTGEVLTNNHVVEDATKISVDIRGRGTFAAKVLGVDPTQDVALIQIENAPKPLPYVSLGDSSSVTVGQNVVAIGNAYGLGGSPSVVTGIVSALNRTITASDESPTSTAETLHGLLQTDAPIAAGDSGGPLVNTKGQVIGMDTAAASGDGGTLGFAIPINEAKSIVTQIEKGQASSTVLLGSTAFLGIYQDPSLLPGNEYGSFGGLPGFGNTGTAAVSGVQVDDVVQGSPAQAAGLQSGDTITAMNGTKTPDLSALQKIISTDKPGDKVTITYVDASGASHTVSVTLAGLPK